MSSNMSPSQVNGEINAHVEQGLARVDGLLGGLTFASEQPEAGEATSSNGGTSGGQGISATENLSNIVGMVVHLSHVTQETTKEVGKMYGQIDYIKQDQNALSKKVHDLGVKTETEGHDLEEVKHKQSILEDKFDGIKLRQKVIIDKLGALGQGFDGIKHVVEEQFPSFIEANGNRVDDLIQKQAGQAQQLVAQGEQLKALMKEQQK